MSCLFHWTYLSVTTSRFLAVDEYGKVYQSPVCDGCCRFICHRVSMQSAHQIIRLQNAAHPRFFLQIDGPSPFRIDAYGNDANQNKKSMLRLVSKTKKKQPLVYLQSVRFNFYISCKPNEMYINQYADNRSAFFRYRIPANTFLNENATLMQLPPFVKSLIKHNKHLMLKMQSAVNTAPQTRRSKSMSNINNNNSGVDNDTDVSNMLSDLSLPDPPSNRVNRNGSNIRPSAPVLIEEEEEEEGEGEGEGAHGSTASSAASTQVPMSALIGRLSKDMQRALMRYGDNDDSEKNRTMHLHSSTVIPSSFTTPPLKHTVIESLFTQKNMNVLPSGHITCQGSRGPFARFVLKNITRSITGDHNDNSDTNANTNANESTTDNGSAGYAQLRSKTKSKSTKEENIVVLIQNALIAEYICVDNTRGANDFSANAICNNISTCTQYWDPRCHWRVVEKSQVLNADPVVMFQSCLNHALLAVNERRMMVSMDISRIDLQRTQFIIRDIPEQNFSLYHSVFSFNWQSKQISEVIQNMIAQKLNGYQIQAPLKHGRVLTNAEKEFFYDYGFLVIKRAIPSAIRELSLQFINDGIERGDHLKGLGAFGLWSCRERCILNLYFQSQLYSMIQSLLGTAVESIVPKAQIALRFPLAQKFGNLAQFLPKTRSIAGTQWHIDGMLLRNATGIGNFSVLCGIVLSDWKQAFMGNFTVYPRSHIHIGRMLQRKGASTFVKLHNNKQTRFNWLTNTNIKPKQILAEIGDVIICHPFLAHCVAPNYSEQIRYAVFVRPVKMDHLQNQSSLVEKDIWTEYEGLRAVQAHKTQTAQIQRRVSAPQYSTRTGIAQQQQQQQQRRQAPLQHRNRQQFQSQSTNVNNNNNNNNSAAAVRGYQPVYNVNSVSAEGYSNANQAPSAYCNPNVNATHFQPGPPQNRQSNHQHRQNMQNMQNRNRVQNQKRKKHSKKKSQTFAV